MTTRILIQGVVAGLNGKDGLIREFWATAKKKRDKYLLLIKSQTKNKHKGKVRITYIGYKSLLMDWDNFAASFKHIGDALVDAKVIVDDKPTIVVKFLPLQYKCKRVNQRVEIIIQDYE